jgi:hypothetical protein
MKAPTSNAGNDTLVCNWITTIPVHGIATDAKMTSWTTSGDGTFADRTVLNTTYTFGTADIAAGVVDLSLIAFAKPPCTGKDTDIKHVLIDPCTGIPGQSQESLRLDISPNPANGVVTLSIQGLNKQALITMTSMEGNTIASFPVDPSGMKITKQFDITGYSKGIYIIKLKTADQVLTEKLVIR